MRVVQINAVYAKMSTGRICFELSEYLNSKGNVCYTVYSVGEGGQLTYKIGNIAENKIHALSSRIFGLQGYFSFFSTIRLFSFLNKFSPDIVHLHNLHANYINLPLLLKYLAKKNISTVITLHDCWFYTGKCTHYTVDQCYRWKTGCFDCKRLKKDNVSWFFDQTTKMWTDKKKLFEAIPRLAVVGVSDWVKNDASQSFLSSAKILTRVHNWVDLSIFKPVSPTTMREKLNLKDKFVVIGVASGWSMAKGLDKFIKLSEILPGDFVILLIGNIKKGINLPPNIINIKATYNTSEMAEYYSMADVFVNLSLEESFGKVAAEALSCGTPVITNNFTANPELIGPGCGYVVENEPCEIIKAIFNVKTSGKESYSEKCVEYAKQMFDKDQRISDYVRIYQELLNQ